MNRTITLFLILVLSISVTHAQCSIGNTNTNAVYPRINQNQIGQSFTATCSGELESVEIETFGTPEFNLNGTLKIFNGQTGHNGTAIYSQAYSLPSNATSCKIDITGTVNLIAGNQYTFIYSAFGLMRFEYNTSATTYTGGTAYWGGTFGHNDDMAFNVEIKSSALSSSKFTEFKNFELKNNANIIEVYSSDKIIKLELINLMGQTIQESNETRLNIQNISNGLYFVKLTSLDNRVGTAKVLKR